MRKLNRMTTGLLTGVCLLMGYGAQAATLYHGWNYAIDSNNDGSGGSIYEDRGLAFTTKGGKVYVAISSNMPNTGNVVGGALNGRVNHGDLFFNFSNHNLDTTAEFNDANVIGVRFDPFNDSLGNIGGSNTTVGVFDQLAVANLTLQNTGYATLLAYNNAGFGRGTDAMADLESTLGDVKAYLGDQAMYPTIAQGRQIGGITLLDRNQLNAQGLDFGHFGIDLGGNKVYGFSFDQSLLPGGDFTMHLFAECINDGMALQASNVPEPGTYAMLGAGLLTMGTLFRRRRARK
jgi:hypothetical protein